MAQRTQGNRQPGKRVQRALALILALLVAGTMLMLMLLSARDPDSAAIAWERTKRLALAKSGSRLPGTPDLADLQGRLQSHALTLGAPVFIRIFKREFELELWMKRDDRYHRFAVYPICRWSGDLGPKLIEGDGQSPEGFYTVDRRALNPNSRWHRSFNLGFPNVFDRAHGRTGSFLMVHGGCSSVGCYAMTDRVVDEIWRLVVAAFDNGQRAIHVHAFPFRPTPDNLDRRKDNPWLPFWQDLKSGYEAFEATQVPPLVTVCAGRYRIESRQPAGSAEAPIKVDCSAEPRA
jgi:murein L,D-transpeptidase YafK